MHKASISYAYIKGAFVAINNFFISGYNLVNNNNIEVLNFDIYVSSISYCVDIKAPGFNIKDSSI
jgi:hypothetical protein